MNRAYSKFEVKTIATGDQRKFSGIATTPTPDRMGDIIEPLGIEYQNPLPLLWQHKHDKPIGHVVFDKPSKDGIGFSAEIASIADPGPLKDRLDEAWQSIKLGLVRGVSIGFRELESEPINPKDFWSPMRFTKSEVLELSAVTVPANAEATINEIRSIDEKLRTAPGPNADRLQQSRARDANRTSKGIKVMKTLSDQISAFEATRAAKAARQNEIMQKSVEDGRTTDAAEQEEFDTLQDEITAIDADLKRLSFLEASNRAAAKPVAAPVPARTVSDLGSAPAPAPVQLKQNLAKGTAFTRYVMALAASRGNKWEAAEFAKRWQNSTPEVEMVIRAAMRPGTVTVSDWAQPLVNYEIMASEFIELLRPLTIVGRIPGLRNVPFMVKIPTQTQGSLVNWVGEALPKPVSELKFGMISLEANKVAGIVVLSEELVRLSNPSAEATVRTDLTAQIAQFIDQSFIDPAKAAVTGVSPASILNGVTGIPSGGGTFESIQADLQAVYNQFIAANLGIGDAVWITTESIALQLGMMQNPLGQLQFPNIGPTGGTLNGIPMITSQSVPAGILALVKASEILIADDGGVTIDVSMEATLQMDSAPVGTNPATFSLWQNNCVGIRAERWITWRRRRNQAVSYLTGVNYDGTTP